MTEAYTAIKMPADIGPNQQATLRCKVDIGAGGNVMPLHAFSKLFLRCVTTDGTPTGLRPTRTRLTAYNRSTIKQYGMLDKAIDWKPEGKNMNQIHTQWYIDDTPGPAILGLLSCSKLGIVELNCAVCFCQKKLTQQKPTTECQEVQKDLTNLQQVNTKKDLIKVYADRFEGIGHFPGTYHITHQNDAKPVVQAPQKCPITMQPLVREKLNESLEQGIIVPVEEPTDWVSSHAYSWKAKRKLRVCLDPRDVNKAIKRDHYKIAVMVWNNK